MNEFLQQFVIESREMAEAATAGLLELERAPTNAQQLDAVFRAFHTLKGGAGIVEFAAMERAVHAAEDVLSEARSGTHPLTTSRVGQCLACLDQVLQWLETIEKDGELPPDAASQADSVINQFQTPADGVTTQPNSVSSAWLDELLATGASGPVTAVRFEPAADSFFKGEDPLSLMTSLPGLLTLKCAPRDAWAALDDFDPYTCNLIFTGLSRASRLEVEAHFQGHSGTCEVVAAMSDHGLPPHVVDLIEAQQALLSGGPPQAFAGRLASAGLTVANALRFCGREEQARALAAAAEQSLSQHSAELLRAAIEQVLKPTSAAPAVLENAMAALAFDPAPVAPDASARTIRIEAAQVDSLVRLAGELTAVNNAIGHVVKLARAGDPAVPEMLKDRHGALEHLIGELQRSVLGMRVRPLRVVLQRFPRLVRELAASLDKSVKLVIEGEHTEADKTIVEMLFEPVLHIVRNAIDHGVETQQSRAAKGKPPVATLWIKVRRQSDQVLIEIGDDGSGIDLQRVAAVARTRGLATEEQLRAMDEAQVIDLIFAPGFSTAAAVTQVSGRGVGMDAVRKAVERIGGRVSLTSRSGQGTTVTLRVPFSVMITHVMTVEAGGQMFGLPLEAVVETIRVPLSAIARVGTALAIVLRNRTIPVVDLANVLGFAEIERDETEVTLVIAAANGEWGGFRVDRVGERLDLILTPLEGLLASTPGIVGTTLLGDGRVLLVLDIGEMLQ